MTKTKKPRYPFKTMKVGDIINVPKNATQQFRNAASAFVADSEPDWKFTIQKVDGKEVCVRIK